MRPQRVETGDRLLWRTAAAPVMAAGGYCVDERMLEACSSPGDKECRQSPPRADL